jgi:hypothetical protein
MTIAAYYITRLPEIKVSELTQLQWAEQQTHNEWLIAKEDTCAAWKMVDDAIEDWDQEAIKDSRALAEFCEDIQSMAWDEWDEAKRILLAHYQ